MLYRHRELETPHGSVTTPVLFPVRNIGKRSSDNTPNYVGEIPEFGTAMVNARSIRQRDEQWNRIKNGATLREELGVPRSTVVFADSGGFDFQSVAVDTTPERTYQTQKRIDADIYGTVDVPLSEGNRNAENHRHKRENINRALAASDQHDGDALLFGSVHGYSANGIKNCISHLESHGDFDGYAVGSLVPIRTNYEKVIDIIVSARESTNKHLHVYGLGGLLYLPLLLYLGVDSFDSSAYIRSAANRNYLIPGFGGEKIENMEQLEYLPCSCPVCKSTELNVVRKDRDALIRHNLWALAVELRRFRYIMETDENPENYLNLRFRGNEVTKRAFNRAKQRVRRLP